MSGQYIVDMAKLSVMNDRLQSSHEQLLNLASKAQWAAQALVETNQLDGRTADNIRGLMRDYHLQTIRVIYELATLIWVQWEKYYGDYRERIDSNPSAFIHRDTLVNGFKRGLINCRSASVAALDEISSALGELEDLGGSDCGFRSRALQLVSCHDECDKRLDHLDQKILEMESRHCASDFREMESLLEVLNALVEGRSDASGSAGGACVGARLSSLEFQYRVKTAVGQAESKIRCGGLEAVGLR